jgi:hypothetical protein
VLQTNFANFRQISFIVEFIKFFFPDVSSIHEIEVRIHLTGLDHNQNLEDLIINHCHYYLDSSPSYPWYGQFPTVHSGHSANEFFNIQWAADCEGTAVEHVGVDHRRPDIFVSKQLLYSADVLTGC